MRGLQLAVSLLSLLVLAGLGHGASAGNAPPTLPHQPPAATLQSPAADMAGDTGELYDIYGPVATQGSLPYLLLCAIAAALLLAALAGYLWLKRRRVVRPEPVAPPWTRALAELEEARQLLADRQGLKYLDRVSQILRLYLEQRFALHPTRQTTREFLQSLAGHDSPLFSYRAELQDCLEQADLAKFAHRLPGRSHLEQLGAAAASLVRKTEPAEPAAASGRTKPTRRGRP